MLHLSFLCGVLASVPTGPPANDALPLRSHAELSAEIERIAGAHDAASLVHLGESREGRALLGLELVGAAGPAAPAILLVANLEGPDVFDSALALEHARALAEGYGNDDGITALLDSTKVYVVPRANPDAAEARFASPRFERTAGGHGVDNDRDGRTGEDGPADVDGDGVIAWMRYRDAEGTWLPDPTDGRALVEADASKGERGEWKLIVEGFDADGDDAIAEDPVHDAVLNRNFSSGWVEHGTDAGLFPTDEPEVRALMDFVLGRSELALVVTYGSPDTLVGKPKTVKDSAPPRMRVPQEGILESDASLLKELGSRYKDTTGNDVAGSSADAGTFQRWCYDHRGLLVLGTALWEMPEEAVEPEAPEETEEAEEAEEAETTEEEPADVAEAEEPEKKSDAKPSQDAKRLSWIDSVADEAWRFLEWKPFEHPTLGPVEIGGFAPFAHREPPAAEHVEMAEKHLAFLVSLGELLPRPAIVSCEAEDLGSGLWRLTAVVENDALLPLQTRSARRTRTIRPALLALDGDAELLGGQTRVQISDLPGAGGRHEEEWLVRTNDLGSLRVTLSTDNAGTASATPEVAQ